MGEGASYLESPYTATVCQHALCLPDVVHVCDVPDVERVVIVYTCQFVVRWVHTDGNSVWVLHCTASRRDAVPVEKHIYVQ